MPSPVKLEQWFSLFSFIFPPGPGEPVQQLLVLYVIIFSFLSKFDYETLIYDMFMCSIFLIVANDKCTLF